MLYCAGLLVVVYNIQVQNLIGASIQQGAPFRLLLAIVAAAAPHRSPTQIAISPSIFASRMSFSHTHTHKRMRTRRQLRSLKHQHKKRKEKEKFV